MEKVDNIFNSLVNNKNGFGKLHSHIYYQYNRYVIDKRIEEALWCHKPFDGNIYHQLYVKGKLEGIIIKFI